MYRLDDLIMEAITTLKEPTGSNKTAIAMYIEVHFQPLAELFLFILLRRMLLSIFIFV